MCAFNKLLFVAVSPMGAHPNTRPLCPRALTQLFRSRISRRLLLQALSKWDKSKWIRYLTCSNGMLVHKERGAALCPEWTGKNKVCKLNWILWIWNFGNCWWLCYCRARRVMLGRTWPSINSPNTPSPASKGKRKKKWNDNKHTSEW